MIPRNPWFRLASSLCCAAWFCIPAFVTTPVTADVTPESSKQKSVADLDELNLAVGAATGTFTPIDDEKVHQAQKAMQEAAERLEDQFQKVGSRSEGWKSYLDWSDLKTTLFSEKPNMDKLKEAYQALAAPYRGLELSCFIDLRLAIEKYMNLRLAADSPKIKAAYDKLMTNLPEMLQKYAIAPTSNPSAPLQQVVTWLDKFDQAPELLAELRHDFAKPNFYASASRQLIAPGFEDTVDEPIDFCDTILKVRVHSKGTMLGETRLELLPSDPSVSPASALLAVNLAGTTTTENQGYRRPVWIYSDSTAQITATKRITINADGISTAAAEANVDTSTHITSICTKNHSRLIENIAWKKARQSKCRAEAIASQHAEKRTRHQVDEQADARIAEANQNYNQRFKYPLWHRKLFPSMLDFSTTADRLKVVALQNGLAQFAAWSDPPTVDETQTDALVHLHESVINNSTWTFLTGRTFAEEEFLDLVADLSGGEVPEQFQPDENQEPWAITFAQENPIRVTFDGDQIRVEIHATKFTKGSSDYTAMNIAVTYRIDSKDGKFALKRLGDLEVFPPGFESENRKLSVREQTLRELLQKRFSKIFKPQWEPRDEVPLPKRWKQTGPLHLESWSTEDGWMTLTWKLDK